MASLFFVCMEFGWAEPWGSDRVLGVDVAPNETPNGRARRRNLPLKVIVGLTSSVYDQDSKIP